MATYISLISFTDQGIRNIKQSPERAQAFRDMVEKAGATVKAIYLDTRQLRHCRDYRCTR